MRWKQCKQIGEAKDKAEYKICGEVLFSLSSFSLMTFFFLVHTKDEIYDYYYYMYVSYLILFVQFGLQCVYYSHSIKVIVMWYLFIMLLLLMPLNTKWKDTTLMLYECHNNVSENTIY